MEKPGAKVVKEIKHGLSKVQAKRIKSRLTDPLRRELYIRQTIKAAQAIFGGE